MLNSFKDTKISIFFIKANFVAIFMVIGGLVGLLVTTTTRQLQLLTFFCPKCQLYEKITLVLFFI